MIHPASNGTTTYDHPRFDDPPKPPIKLLENVDVLRRPSSISVIHPFRSVATELARNSNPVKVHHETSMKPGKHRRISRKTDVQSLQCYSLQNGSTLDFQSVATTRKIWGYLKNRQSPKFEA
jgi:hypothetical protein